MLPRENFDKNGEIWCNLGVPKYVITILKINNFKVTKSTTTEFNCHIFSQLNVDVHAILNFLVKNLKGGSGWLSPQKQKNFFKNRTKWRLFLYFFCFLAGLPRSPKL